MSRLLEILVVEFVICFPPQLRQKAILCKGEAEFKGFFFLEILNYRKRLIELSFIEQSIYPCQLPAVLAPLFCLSQVDNVVDGVDHCETQSGQQQKYQESEGLYPVIIAVDSVAGGLCAAIGVIPALSHFAPVFVRKFIRRIRI